MAVTPKKRERKKSTPRSLARQICPPADMSTLEEQSSLVYLLSTKCGKINRRTEERANKPELGASGNNTRKPIPTLSAYNLHGEKAKDPDDSSLLTGT